MPDTSSLDLVRTAYEQCGRAYDTAVEVYKFSWTMFYSRSAALLGAAGYIALKSRKNCWVAVLLLALGAVMTSHITKKQMVANQMVIRKAIVAGLNLERSHADLGCRFKLDTWGDRLNDNLTVDQVSCGPPGDIGKTSFGQLGLAAKVPELVDFYTWVFVGFATIAFAYWLGTLDFNWSSLKESLLSTKRRTSGR